MSENELTDKQRAILSRVINTSIAVGALLAVIGLCIKEGLVTTTVGTLLAVVGLCIKAVWYRGKKK